MNLKYFAYITKNIVNNNYGITIANYEDMTLITSLNSNNEIN